MKFCLTAKGAIFMQIHPYSGLSPEQQECLQGGVCPNCLEVLTVVKGHYKCPDPDCGWLWEIPPEEPIDHAPTGDL